MLTFAQRQKFFAAAHSAYLAVRPAAPFDEWRQNEMELIGLPASTKQMDHVWHFTSRSCRTTRARCPTGAGAPGDGWSGYSAGS